MTMYRVVELDKHDNTLNTIEYGLSQIEYIGGNKGNMIDFDKLFNSFKPNPAGVCAVLQGNHKYYGWQTVETRYK